MANKNILVRSMLLLTLCGSLLGCAGKADEVSLQESLLSGTYFDGMSIAGADVGGRSIDEARSLVKQALDDQLGLVSIELQYDGRSWILDQEKLAVSYDLEQSLQDAMLYCVSGTKGEIKERKEQATENGYDVPVQLSLDETALNAVLENVAVEVKKDPVDPYAEFTPNSRERFAYHEGENGVTLDVSKAAGDVKSAFDTQQFPTQIPLSATATPPTVTLEEIKENTQRIASATTSYDGNSKSERVHNLKLGAEKINGVKVSQGEAFSFNKTVGPRNEANGWKKAATIVGGNMYEDDFGGGICQISTTLYNAVLKSDLTVTDRQRHSIPSSYVKYGLDATVSYDSKDFKFQNNTDYPVYIVAVVDESAKEVSIGIYGRPLPDGRSIKLTSKTVAETPPQEAEVIHDETSRAGSTEVVIKERNGYTVEVYKEYVDASGEVVESVKLYTDTYKPVRGVIRVGMAGESTNSFEEPGEAAGGDNSENGGDNDDGGEFDIPEEGE